MQRRTFVAAAVAVFLSLAGSARADMVADPPPPLEVRARPTTHEGAGAPTIATWELQNRGTATLHVRLASIVAQLDGMRLPLRIVSVRIAGRDAAREFDLGAGATTLVEIRFEGLDGPATRADAWTIELGAAVTGGGAHGGHVAGTTLVRRGATRVAR